METMRDNYPHEYGLYSELAKCTQGPVGSSSIRRAILLLLRAHYSHTDNYTREFSHLETLSYDPANPKSSTLYVGDGIEFEPESTSLFPGVFVTGSGMDLGVKLGFSDAVSATEDTSGSILGKGATLNLSIVHVTPNETTSTDLAETTLALLFANKAVLSDSMGLTDWDLKGISQPTRVKESPETMYAVAVGIRVSFTWSVRAFEESHRIKKFVMEVRESLR